MQLRYYQRQAVDACWNFLANRDGNPAIVLPTGAGKSPTMAAMASEAVTQWNGRIGIIQHSIELVKQNHDKLVRMWPDAPAGIYASSLRRRDRFDQIEFLQIQSVYDKVHEFGRFDLLFVDEAHRIPTHGQGMYRRFLSEATRFNRHLRVLGLTATPYRLGIGPVCSEHNILNEIAYEARIQDLIDDGYLSRPRTLRGQARADMSSVHVRKGEYVERELADAFDRDSLIGRTCDEICTHAEYRKAWILFAVSVDHAKHVAEAMRRRGIDTGVISDKTRKGEREELIQAYQLRQLKAIVNVNVLTEGFDAPHIDYVGMLRPTMSPGLYYQMVGRGFRIFADGIEHPTREARLAAIANGPKPDFLVGDFAGNALEHGPVDAIRVSRPKKSGEKITVEKGKVKECPKCSAVLPLGARVCECGHKFGSSDSAHSDRPVDAPVLSTERERVRVTHAVSSVSYARHDKPGKTPSLKVTYQCGLRRFSEWVCIEHDGLARAKAIRWWQARTIDQCPRTVEEALPLAWKLPNPVSILVDETDKYPEILSHEFAAPEHQREASNDQVSTTDAGSAAGATRSDTVPGMRGVPGWLVRALDGSGAGRRAA